MTKNIITGVYSFIIWAWMGWQSPLAWASVRILSQHSGLPDVARSDRLVVRPYQVSQILFTLTIFTLVHNNVYERTKKSFFTEQKLFFPSNFLQTN